MLPKKKFGSEKREKKNKMKANKITTNELKKNYDVLYKGPFFHIMPKTRKTLGITLLIKLWWLLTKSSFNVLKITNMLNLSHLVIY